MDKSNKRRMISTLNSEPAWDWYSSYTSQTQNVKSHFFDINEYQPSGLITGPLTFNETTIETPLSK
jgi:hypothetical protein